MIIELKSPNEFQKTLILKGFSQRSFAKSLGFSAPYVSQIISKRRNPSSAAARKITELLGVEFDEIFFIKDVRKS
ncbi:helix-turn-helix domain-containing protein [Bacillus mycoides]|uniref:helix-turn-helix domain-containing protein n=1 Tax=Bacillus mycoides TaxID=1405 RepID=UPI00119E82CA|nr:helix-turn-helix transcriptional regulator [Bacillus mycoides]